MDIRFNQSSKVCAYSSDDKELCTALTEESEAFVETLKQFQSLSQRVTQQIRNTSATIECKKHLAIGIRNTIEIEYEDHESLKIASLYQQRIAQKKDELIRLNAEYESLLQVSSVQKSQITRV